MVFLPQSTGYRIKELGGWNFNAEFIDSMDGLKNMLLNI